MHRVSGISAQAKSGSPRVARLSAIVALAATIVIIVVMLEITHPGGASTIHTIRPLPHNYFGP